MQITALVLALVGLVLTTAGSVWLLFGFSPTNPRYVDDGMLYPGNQRSKVIPNLLRDQRKVSALIVLGAAIQVVGGVFAVLSAR